MPPSECAARVPRCCGRVVRRSDSTIAMTWCRRRGGRSCPGRAPRWCRRRRPRRRAGRHRRAGRSGRVVPGPEFAPSTRPGPGCRRRPGRPACGRGRSTCRCAAVPHRRRGRLAQPVSVPVTPRTGSRPWPGWRCPPRPRSMLPAVEREGVGVSLRPASTPSVRFPGLQSQPAGVIGSTAGCERLVLRGRHVRFLPSVLGFPNTPRKRFSSSRLADSMAGLRPGRRVDRVSGHLYGHVRTGGW